MTEETQPQTTYTIKHEYFYQLYKELTPQKRNIRQLRITLQEHERNLQQQDKTLPYKIPQEKTLRKWCKQDKWDERFYNEIQQEYKNIDFETLETTKEYMKLDTTIGLQHYNILNEIQQITLKLLQQYNTDTTYKQVRIIQSWCLLACKLMQVKKGLTSDYAETYSIIKFLGRQNDITQDQHNILKEVGNMLGCDTEEQHTHNL